MSWERDALWAKAVLFMQRASSEDRESATFGLWASLGLELVARSAIANTSPALLAEPDRDQKNILHALGVSLSNAPKSVSTIQVLSLCRTLVAEFTEDEFKICSSLLNRRNEELHTGAAAFDTFPTQTWLAGFYRASKILSEHQGESLESLFGAEESRIADQMLTAVKEDVIGKVKSSIAAHKKVFDAKDEPEKYDLLNQAEADSEVLSHKGYHRVQCPACSASATVNGTTYGGERIEHKDGRIVVRESVIPTGFRCKACDLKLTGYQQLVVAGLGDHFTNRSEYDPPDYYELIDPNDHEVMASYAEDHGFYHFAND